MDFEEEGLIFTLCFVFFVEERREFSLAFNDINRWQFASPTISIYGKSIRDRFQFHFFSSTEIYRQKVIIIFPTIPPPPPEAFS